jgi:N-dimethylarginine dimethylaminohydrolase
MLHLDLPFVAMRNGAALLCAAAMMAEKDSMMRQSGGRVKRPPAKGA